jgi:TusE/DsrC/DsvC family sulfur relay protein
MNLTDATKVYGKRKAISVQNQRTEESKAMDTMNDILHPRDSDAADPGFPHAPQGWSRETAARTADSEGLTTGTDHWEAVRALQAYFARNADTGINAREVHDALDEKFHAKGGIKYLYTLFPRGPLAQGCRLAGLEPPAGSEDASFGSVM